MKTLFKLSKLVVIFPLMMSCIQEEKPNTNNNTVRITIQATNVKAPEVKIITYDMLNLKDSTLAEIKLDTTGAGMMEFALSRPILASLIVDEKNTGLYLAPGYDLQISMNGENFDKTLHYEGSGSEANRYLTQVSLIKEKFYRGGGAYFWNVKPKEFVDRTDSMKNALYDFHRQYNDSIALPKDVNAFLAKKNKVEIEALKQEYLFLLKNNAVVEAMINGEEIKEFTMPEPLSNVVNEVPFDTTFLNHGMLEYAQLLEKRMDAEIYLSFYTGKTAEEIEAIREHLPVMADKEIKKGKYPAAFREFFIAKNIDYWMKSKGLIPAIDSLYTDFKKQYSGSAYLPSLESRYNRWLAVSPGAPAPEITGTTPEGKKLSLRDLQGKVVYVDVWATWRRPCIEEFPYSKKLQKQLEGNDQVVFLYVSVDKDQQKWEKFLKADKDFKGTHIIDQLKESSELPSIWKAYMINGIPRYMLIDQQGKIVDADASRPSSGKVKDQLEAILNINKEYN